MAKLRKTYPGDVNDEAWDFCLSYLMLLDEKPSQRIYPLRELFNGLQWLVRAFYPWNMVPNDIPPWSAVFQLTQPWVKAVCFEVIAHDFRAINCLALDKKPKPPTAIIDSTTLQSTPNSGARASFNCHKERKGFKIHASVDTVIHLLAIHVTLANEQDRTQGCKLVKGIQEAAEQSVQLAYVDQGSTREEPAEAGSVHEFHEKRIFSAS